MTAGQTRFLHKLGAAFALLFGLWSAPAMAAPCAENCLTPGDHRLTLDHGGVTREYFVHVPARYDGSRSVPLLLDFHGYSSDAEEERRVSGQLAQSDARGFIAVWPNGVGRAWTAYGCCFLNDAARQDDVGFVRAMVGVLKARLNIDDARVFATGISNGGAMSHRLACEAADIFRAAAPVAYPLNTTECRPSRPVTVLAIHGTEDETIAYAGRPHPANSPAGIPIGVQGARDSFAAWTRINTCTDEATRTPIPPRGEHFAGSAYEEHRACANNVRVGLLTIQGGRHVLYNGFTRRDYTGENSPIDLADFIWTHAFNF